MNRPKLPQSPSQSRSHRPAKLRLSSLESSRRIYDNKTYQSQLSKLFESSIPFAFTRKPPSNKTTDFLKTFNTYFPSNHQPPPTRGSIPLQTNVRKISTAIAEEAQTPLTSIFQRISLSSAPHKKRSISFHNNSMLPVGSSSRKQRHQSPESTQRVEKFGDSFTQQKRKPSPKLKGLLIQKPFKVGMAPVRTIIAKPSQGKKFLLNELFNKSFVQENSNKDNNRTKLSNNGAIRLKNRGYTLGAIRKEDIGIESEPSSLDLEDAVMIKREVLESDESLIQDTEETFQGSCRSKRKKVEERKRFNSDGLIFSKREINKENDTKAIKLKSLRGSPPKTSKRDLKKDEQNGERGREIVKKDSRGKAGILQPRSREERRAERLVDKDEIEEVLKELAQVSDKEEVKSSKRRTVRSEKKEEDGVKNNKAMSGRNGVRRKQPTSLRE